MVVSHIAKSVHGLIMNPVFISAVSSWLVAQFTKTLIALVRRKVKTIKDLFELLLWRTGGMPSSHSALVVSAAAAIGFDSGIDSDLFALALCFTLVVMRDAVGVRRSSGIQARALNDLGVKCGEALGIAYKPIKEIQGHRPSEVIMGGVLGFFIAFAYFVL